MNGPDTPGTFTPREPRKGLCFDQIEAFLHMQQLGEDVVEAALACLTGHRMTPNLAAQCIATYWRRCAAIANYQESRGAAITPAAFQPQLLHGRRARSPRLPAAPPRHLGKATHPPFSCRRRQPSIQPLGGGQHAAMAASRRRSSLAPAGEPVVWFIIWYVRRSKKG